MTRRRRMIDRIRSRSKSAARAEPEARDLRLDSHQVPRSGFRVRVRGSARRSEFLVPGSAFGVPRSGFGVRGVRPSVLRFIVLQLSEPRTGTKNPEPGTENAELRTEPRTRTRNPEPGTRNDAFVLQGSGIPESGYGRLVDDAGVTRRSSPSLASVITRTDPSRA
jgi:hypothetical protein